MKPKTFQDPKKLEPKLHDQLGHLLTTGMYFESSPPVQLFPTTFLYPFGTR